MKYIFLLFLFTCFVNKATAQFGGTQKMVSKKQQHIVDSLKSTPYPFVFPMLGDKVRKKGILLPLPHGMMINYLQGIQQIAISDLSVGFNNGQVYDLSELVQFEEVKGNLSTLNARFDTWVLPFLDVYGIAGYGKGTLKVHLKEPFDFETTTDADGQYYGIGAMLTGALGPVFIANDYNYSWSFNDKLKHPANIFMTGLRCGPIFRIPKHEHMNISVWTGFMYSQLKSSTTGNIRFTEVFPDSETKLNDLESDLDDWYVQAYAEAKLPAKKELINKIYTESKDAIHNIQQGVDSGSIQYQLQKKFENPFSMLAGIQWQISEKWQLRCEAQFFGDRQMFLTSLNYRFGIKGKTLFSS